MSSVLRLVRPYWAAVAGGLLCLIAATGAQLFVPRYLGLTIDRIVQTKSLREAPSTSSASIRRSRHASSSRLHPSTLSCIGCKAGAED